MEWWEAPEWGKEKAMDFGKAPGPDARTRRVPLTTDPELVRLPSGATRLRLRNRHPHTAERIFIGPTKVERC